MKKKLIFGALTLTTSLALALAFGATQTPDISNAKSGSGGFKHDMFFGDDRKKQQPPAQRLQTLLAVYDA